MHIQPKNDLAKRAHDEYSRAAIRMSHQQAIDHVAALLHLTSDTVIELIDHIAEAA